MSIRASIRVENNHFPSVRPSLNRASSSSINENVATCSMPARHAVHVDRHQDGASEAAMLDSGGVLTPDFFYRGRSSRVLHTHAVSKSEARVRERKVARASGVP